MAVPAARVRFDNIVPVGTNLYDYPWFAPLLSQRVLDQYVVTNFQLGKVVSVLVEVLDLIAPSFNCPFF